jgi:hypothetical protein
MRKYSKFIVAGSAIAALAVPTAAMALSAAPAMADATSNTTCATPPVVGYNSDGSPQYGGKYNGMSMADGTVIPGNLKIPAGVTCRVGWIEVKGNVIVTGGELDTFGASTFDMNVNVDGGRFVATNYPIHIKQNLSISNTSSQSGFWTQYWGPSQIDGSISYTNNSGQLYIDYNGVNATSLTYSNNTGPAPDLNGLHLPS